MSTALRSGRENTNARVAQRRIEFGERIREPGVIDTALARPGELSPAAISQLLEWAGATLLSTRLSAGRPAAMRGCWPDYLTTFAEAYGWTGERLRPAIPGAHDISCMDVILGWISLIPVHRYVLRRIVGARSLVNPLTHRYLFSYARIGTLLGADRRAVVKWYADGVNLIEHGLKYPPVRFPFGTGHIYVDDRATPRRP